MSNKKRELVLTVKGTFKEGRPPLHSLDKISVDRLLKGKIKNAGQPSKGFAAEEMMDLLETIKVLLKTVDI